MKEQPEFETNSHIRRMKFVKKLIGNKKGKTLDIGCYKGFLYTLLDKEAYEYQGIDFKKWNKNLNVLIQDLNNKTKLPFKNNFFDIVVCTDTLEHLFYPNKIIKEIKRVMKKDGIAILSLPNELNIIQRLKILFGINPIKFDYYEHHWFFDIGLARKFIKKFFKKYGEYTYPLRIFPSLFTIFLFFKIRK